MLPTHGQIMVVILLFLSIFMFSTDNKMEGMKQIEKKTLPLQSVTPSNNKVK